MNSPECSALCLADNGFNSTRIALHVLFHIVKQANLVLLLENIKSSCVDCRFQLVRLFLTGLNPKIISRNGIHYLCRRVIELVKLSLTSVALFFKLGYVAVSG